MVKNRKSTTKDAKKEPEKKPFWKSPWVYGGSGLVISAAVVGGLLLQPPEPEPAPEPTGPAVVSLSAESPAHTWAAQYTTDSTKGDIDRTTGLVPSAQCTFFSEAPIENLYTGSGVLDDSEFNFQILAPGTSGKIFAEGVESSGSCWPKTVEATESEGFKYFPAGDGFIAQIGDVLVYTEEPEEKAATDFFAKIASSLTESTCVSTEVRETDYTRNKHFSEDDYTGRITTETVESTLPLTPLPKVAIPEVVEIEDPDAEQPEGPLDPSVPAKPDDDLTKPTIPDPIETTTEPFTAEARYQISDVEGPGCGWGWTAWELPEETDADLTDSKETGVQTAQDEANAQANAYMNKQTRNAAGSFTTVDTVNTWNTYANKMNSAHERWAWLEEQRAKLKPDWDKYVKAHNFWTDFDELKEEAKTEYDEDVQSCNDAQKEQEDWDRQYDDSESQGGGNTGVPERPKGCSEEPKEPEIISQDRPKQPIQPTIPKGVTVPDSWDQPK